MADLFSAAERAMNMDDRVWARHAHPLSVWSRIAAGPVIFLALWSIHRIGWLSVLPIAAAGLWIFANPRLFPPPRRADRWSTRAVLGERAFLLRKETPIPDGYGALSWLTASASVIFLALFVYALFTENFVAGFAAWHGAIVAKLWFVDRMAILWDEMKGATPRYQAWARAEWDVVSPR